MSPSVQSDPKINAAGRTAFAPSGVFAPLDAQTVEQLLAPLAPALANVQRNLRGGSANTLARGVGVGLMDQAAAQPSVAMPFAAPRSATAAADATMPSSAGPASAPAVPKSAALASAAPTATASASAPVASATSSLSSDGEPLEYGSIEDASAVLADNFAALSPDGAPIDSAMLKKLVGSNDPTIAAAAKYMLQNPAEWHEVSATWGTEGSVSLDELRDAFDGSANNMDSDSAADALNRYYTRLDPTGQGIDEAALRNAMADPTSPPQLRAAAKYLLQNPDDFTSLKNTMGDNQGVLTRAALEQSIANNSDADPMDPYTAAATLRANFKTLSPNGDSLTMDKLREIANIGASPEAREAARYLLNNPQDFHAADVSTGEGANQAISFAELGAAVDAGSDTMEPQEAALGLQKYWAELSPDGKEVSKERLRAVANDPSQPDGLQRAARFYLQNETRFTELDAMGGGKPDLKISKGDVELMAAGFDPEDPHPGAALDTLMRQFDKFKGADGNVHIPEDLRRVLNDPDATPELRIAAATVLHDPEMQTDLEGLGNTSSGAPDGVISYGDVRGLWELAHPDPNLENMGKARQYQLLFDNFDKLKDADGNLTRDSLQKSLQDPTASRELREAAKQLLNGVGSDENGAPGDAFRELAGYDGWGAGQDNNKISQAEMKAALDDASAPKMNLGDAISQLKNVFDKYKEGKFLTAQGLLKMVNDPEATPQLKQAAKLMLANPDAFNTADTGNDGGTGDGLISYKDLSAAEKDSGSDEFSKAASRWKDQANAGPARGPGRTTWQKVVDFFS